MTTAAVVMLNGISTTLLATLDGIASIGGQGDAKFTPATRHALHALIAGRAYAPALHELCHLVRIAARAPGRRSVEAFFWGIPLARPGAYAGWLRRHATLSSPAVPVVLEPAAAVLRYPDGSFAVSYGRMPLLAALMEFLVSTIGYAAVAALIDGLLDEPATRARAAELSNALSRDLYAWLAPHLPTAHDQRRFRQLADFMAARGDGDFSTDDIDDDAILQFWLHGADEEFRTYAGVLRAFLRFAEALEEAAAALEAKRPLTVGAAAEAGEIEPAVMAGDAAPGLKYLPLEPGEAPPDPLAALAEPPAEAVKFLNNRERAELAPLFEAGARAELLVLSLLRRAAFAPLQARLIEAARRGAALPALEPGLDYAALLQRHAALAVHLDRAMAASLHVLATAGRPEAVHFVLALVPDADLSGLRAHAGDMAGAIRRLADPTVAGARVAAFMLQARRAFNDLARAGFEREAPGSAATVEAHAAAAAHLPGLSARLARFRARLEARPPATWEAAFEHDRALFAARFAALYGASSSRPVVS
jgi:hypothetical protein